MCIRDRAVKAWRDGGEQWESVNSRIVTARLKLRDCKRIKHLFIVGVQAPTFHSPRQDKGDFYADLQSVLDDIPEEDVLVVLRDWNAKVGSVRAVSVVCM